jgi:hypothetical protein
MEFTWCVLRLGCCSLLYFLNEKWEKEGVEPHIRQLRGADVSGKIQVRFFTEVNTG